MNDNGHLVPVGLDAETLIAKALEHNVPIETMERLLAMRTQLKAERAKEAFFSALSNFQSECPIIQKGRQVKSKDGSVRYSYANLEDIITTSGPHLKNNGLSYTIKAEFKEEGIIASCVAHHVMGHSEESSFAIPIEKEAFMNDAQKSGSALTYAKRYAFCNAFGIMTGDQDDDAQSTGPGKSIEDMYRKFSYLMAAVLKHYDAIMLIKDCIAKGDYASGAETWFQLDNDVKQSIWAAPTKGGPFTSEEREIIKTKEWREAYYGKEVESKEEEKK